MCAEALMQRGPASSVRCVLHFRYHCFPSNMRKQRHSLSYRSIHTYCKHTKTFQIKKNLMQSKCSMQSCTLYTDFIRRAPCRGQDMMGGTWSKVPSKHTHYLDGTRPAERSTREKIRRKMFTVKACSYYG